MIAEALSTLAGGMMPWEWIHRLKQSAVNLSRALICAGCSLAPLKNLEQALWAAVHSQDTSSGRVLSPDKLMTCVLGYRSMWCSVVREQSQVKLWGDKVLWHTKTAHTAEGPDKQHKIKSVTWKLQLRCSWLFVLVFKCRWGWGSEGWVLQAWPGKVSQGQTGVQGSGGFCIGGCGRRASLGNLTTNRLYLIPARQ